MKPRLFPPPSEAGRWKEALTKQPTVGRSPKSIRHSSNPGDQFSFGSYSFLIEMDNDYTKCTLILIIDGSSSSSVVNTCRQITSRLSYRNCHSICSVNTDVFDAQTLSASEKKALYM